MRLQPHQLKGIGKGKWITQFNHPGLQHQTHDKYYRNTRAYCQTQKMELTLQGKNLDFAKKGIFKAKYNSQFLSHEISSLKKVLRQKALLEL